MLSPLLARGGVTGPDEIWSAWNFDPLLLSGIGLTVLLYVRGRRRPDGSRRQIQFGAGIAALVVALMSPLDAMAESLASAHMVQHLLLGSLAAPLLVFSAPEAAILRGSPLRLRSSVFRGRRQVGLTTTRLRLLRRPELAWFLVASALWGWHAKPAYEAALGSETLHRLAHLSFFVGGLAVWSVIRHAGRSGRPSYAFTIIFLFTLGFQTTILAALMTFSPNAWYTPYRDTTEVWGLTHLADQQLAGLLMWFPASMIYLGAVLWLLSSWLRHGAQPSQTAANSSPGRVGPQAGSSPSVSYSGRRGKLL